MKELKNLSEDVLRKTEVLIKSFSYEKGQMDIKFIKGYDKETKDCSICLVLGMLFINILSSSKIKDKDNRKMLEELFNKIDKTRQALKIGKK